MCRSSFFLKPCDSIAERTFPVFYDFPGILDRSPFARASARLVCSPEGLNDPDCAPLKLPFPSPHHLSSLLSLTWYTKCNIRIWNDNQGGFHTCTRDINISYQQLLITSEILLYPWLQECRTGKKNDNRKVRGVLRKVRKEIIHIKNLCCLCADFWNFAVIYRLYTSPEGDWYIYFL